MAKKRNIGSVSVFERSGIRAICARAIEVLLYSTPLVWLLQLVEQNWNCKPEMRLSFRHSLEKLNEIHPIKGELIDNLINMVIGIVHILRLISVFLSHHLTKFVYTWCLNKQIRCLLSYCTNFIKLHKNMCYCSFDDRLS